MKLKLWHKVAMTMIITSSVTLLVTLLLMKQSLRSNFLNYLNEKEQQRLAPVIDTLRRHYQQQGHWEALRGDKKQWRRIVARSLMNQRKPFPPLDGNQLSRFEPAMEFMQKRREALGSDKPPHHLPPPIKAPRLTLLDINKQRIVGYQIRQHTKSKSYIPINTDHGVIGYIQLERIYQLSNALDKSFWHKNYQNFMYIGLLSILLSSLSAWLLSSYLRGRITPLTTHAQQLSAGEYQHYTPNKHSDELGQLNNDLNHLSSTLDKNRHARQQWIADISHELRTPLAILQGELEALEDGIRPLNHSAVQSLAGEIKRLNKLVDDLYQLSLSDLGALTYKKHSINPIDCIESVTQHFESRLDEKQLTLIKHCSQDSNQPSTIDADPERLKQLLTNLLENSIRYTHEKGRIEFHCYHDGRHYTIELQDSTPSVATEQLPHLFERLYRTEDSRNRETGGAGLGLAIAKEIVIAHQGSITASQSPLGGLTITMTFPII